MRKVLVVAMLLAVCTAFAEVPESHRAAALEFLEAKGTPQLLARNCRTMLERQLAVSPDYMKHRAELEKFYFDTFGFAALKEDLIAMYVREYSEAELRELAKFYRSELGRKSVAVEEKLVPEFAELLERKVREKLGVAPAK